MWPVDDSPARRDPQGTGGETPPASLAFLDLTLDGIAANLALDEAFLIEAEEGRAGPILRLWESPELAVVLGASGRWRDEVRVENCRADGVALARRSSGGGTVVLGPGALNFTVVLPLDFAPGLAAVDRAQLYVLERVAQGLRAEGAPVEVKGSGDLTLGLRKFSGSAQRRLRRHFLVHATILHGFPLERISRYLAVPARQPSYREGRPHADFVTNLGLARERIVHALRSTWLWQGVPPPPAVVPTKLVEELVASRYGDRAWTERL